MTRSSSAPAPGSAVSPIRPSPKPPASDAAQACPSRSISNTGFRASARRPVASSRNRITGAVTRTRRRPGRPAPPGRDLAAEQRVEAAPARGLVERQRGELAGEGQHELATRRAGQLEFRERQRHPHRLDPPPGQQRPRRDLDQGARGTPHEVAARRADVEVPHSEGQGAVLARPDQGRLGEAGDEREAAVEQVLQHGLHGRERHRPPAQAPDGQAGDGSEHEAEGGDDLQQRAPDGDRPTALGHPLPFGVVRPPVWCRPRAGATATPRSHHDRRLARPFRRGRAAGRALATVIRIRPRMDCS